MSFCAIMDASAGTEHPWTDTVGGDGYWWDKGVGESGIAVVTV